tara:strand:+ start:9718 stop:10233 length:516 start_codon:yes stop_codon:yes gene_type:complete
MGAGILPVAIYKNKLYFLFGKETFDDSGETGWSDFGGASDSTDNTIFDTAVREGEEELNGFLGVGRNFYNRVKTNIIHVERSRHYSAYIFLIDYNKELPIYYNNHFRFFSQKLPDIKKEHNGLLEKSHIKWYSFEDMRRERRNFRRFYKSFIDRYLENQDLIVKKCFEKSN